MLARLIKVKSFLSIKLVGGLAIGIGAAIIAWGFFTPHIPTNTPTVSTLPLASATDTRPLPWQLRIPAIGLDTAIQEVGLTRDGKMGIPSSYTEVGWVKTSAQPGQPGNAVITGHINLDPRQPGVFQNLHKAKVGDFVYVQKDGQEQRFKIVDSQAYETNKAPLQSIIGATDKTYLNLITCAGTWDKAKQEYDQRLVVFTELSTE